MARASARPRHASHRIRDLRQRLRELEREAPGPDRAIRLAEVVRAAHDDQQLNIAMHSAVLCLADDPDAPELLLTVFADADEPLEDRLLALGGLRDLARYIDRSDVAALAAGLQRATAHRFVEEAATDGRDERLRTVATVISPAAADDLRRALDDEG